MTIPVFDVDASHAEIASVAKLGRGLTSAEVAKIVAVGREALAEDGPEAYITLPAAAAMMLIAEHCQRRLVGIIQSAAAAQCEPAERC